MRSSKSFLAEEAIAENVGCDAWQEARIKEALTDAHSGTPGVPQQAVEEWVKSWGTANELPRPAVKSS